MNDNVLTKDCGVLADAMQSVRRSLKMADRLADGYIPPMGGERYRESDIQKVLERNYRKAY